MHGYTRLTSFIRQFFRGDVFTHGNVKAMAIRDEYAAQFGTLIPAMVTVLTEDGEVDYSATVEFAKRLVDRGADGLVVTGTTGESSTLDDDERIELYRLVKEAVGDRAKVIAGSTSNHTSHSVELSQAAEAVGADAILLVTPYYNKPSQGGLIAHSFAVADALTIPVMLYDIPGRSGVPLSTATIQELAKHPRINALKDAKGDFNATTEVIATTDLAIYSGDDGLTLPLMAAGAAGVVSVSANVATEGYRALVDAMAAGDLATARARHLELDPVQRAFMSHLQGGVATKAILKDLGIINNDGVRLPWVPATDTERDEIWADLESAGWSRPTP